MTASNFRSSIIDTVGSRGGDIPKIITNLNLIDVQFNLHSELPIPLERNATTYMCLKRYRLVLDTNIYFSDYIVSQFLLSKKSIKMRMENLMLRTAQQPASIRVVENMLMELVVVKAMPAECTL